jgi:OFA family oxalate/formate antiporter-like MFS transporter
MLKTPMFWILWLTYFAGCTAGLQVIMKASPIWQSFTMGSLPPPIAEADFHKITSAGAMAVSILAIFNALGRILWGKISDSIGRKGTLMVMFVICGGAMLALDAMRSYPLYLTAICLVGLCFGGYLALYPVVTADFYGTKHIGVNYGWMFSAYGAGGLVGPWLAAKLMTVVAKVPYQVTEPSGVVQKEFEVGSYRQAFVAAGIACLVAAVVCLVIKAPRPPQAAAEPQAAQ